MKVAKVTYTDGLSYKTRVADDVDLKSAQSYFMQAPHVYEVNGQEVKKVVASVELSNVCIDCDNELTKVESDSIYLDGKNGVLCLTCSRVRIEKYRVGQKRIAFCV